MNGFEDKFDQFLDETEEREAIKAEFRAIEERYAGFLAERGVETELPHHRIDITKLATYKMMVEEVLLLRPDLPDPYKIKMKLQASFAIRNYDPAWSELADQEFPGGYLEKDDIDTIAKEFREELDVSEEIQAKQEKTRTGMMNHLIEWGVVPADEIAPEDDEMLDVLGFFHNVQHMKPQDRHEFARAILGRHGYLDDPAWKSMLTKFFPA